MSYDKILKEVKNNMQDALTWLETEFKIIRTGRATPALLDHIRVDYYGDKTPIKNLANISIPEPRVLAIKPFDPSVLKNMEKAILASNLGLTPSNDGHALRLNIPALSEEQRKKIANILKEHAEKSRISIRNARRDGNKNADGAQKKDKILTEDQSKKLKGEIQDLTKESESQVDDMLKKKTEEIMEI
ncbi:ribosome recycling factor [Planctomycetota bacterium]